MAVYNRYGQARAKKKTNTMFAPLIFILVLVAMVFFVGVFFRVQDIRVEGSSSYTDEQIIEASGVEKGDNLFFINRFSASSSIFTKLPFVDEASISREMPNTVVITISESVACAYVSWQEQSWMLTSEGKLLGTADEELRSTLISVSGIQPVSPSQGEKMQVAASDESKLTYLCDLLKALESNGLLSSVSQIDMSVAASPTFEYINRFEVKLGADDQLDYKLKMLLATVGQLQPEEMGTIDVSDGSTVYVSID